jgi:hypothetical protein
MLVYGYDRIRVAEDLADEEVTFFHVSDSWSIEAGRGRGTGSLSHAKMVIFWQFRGKAIECLPADPKRMFLTGSLPEV